MWQKKKIVPQNDENFGAKFKNHAQLQGLITKLVEEVLESLEASKSAKTNYFIIPLQFDKFSIVPQNDANFGAKFKNHAQLQGLIAKLIVEVLLSLEASEPAKTNRVLFQACHNAATHASQLEQLSKIPPEIK